MRLPPCRWSSGMVPFRPGPKRPGEEPLRAEAEAREAAEQRQGAAEPAPAVLERVCCVPGLFATSATTLLFGLTPLCSDDIVVQQVAPTCLSITLALAVALSLALLSR